MTEIALISASLSDGAPACACDGAFNIGLKQGLIEGKLEGEATVLSRLLTRRFGPLSEEAQARLDNANLGQLERWADNILEAATLEDVFKEN